MAPIDRLFSELRRAGASATVMQIERALREGGLKLTLDGQGVGLAHLQEHAQMSRARVAAMGKKWPFSA
jgi:hypothetical protein